MTCKSNEQRKCFLCHDVAVIIYLKNRLHRDSVRAQKQQNRCRSIVRVLKCLCRGGVVFASCWSSVHVKLDFPLKAMQIYAFSVESPNKIGYFFDLSQNIYKEQSTKESTKYNLQGTVMLLALIYVVLCPLSLSMLYFVLNSMLVRMAVNSA